MHVVFIGNQTMIINASIHYGTVCMHWFDLSIYYLFFLGTLLFIYVCFNLPIIIMEEVDHSESSQKFQLGQSNDSYVESFIICSLLLLMICLLVLACLLTAKICTPFFFLFITLSYCTPTILLPPPLTPRPFPLLCAHTNQWTHSRGKIP